LQVALLQVHIAHPLGKRLLQQFVHDGYCSLYTGSPDKNHRHYDNTPTKKKKFQNNKTLLVNQNHRSDEIPETSIKASATISKVKKCDPE
jgi:hypothetical protein